MMSSRTPVLAVLAAVTAGVLICSPVASAAPGGQGTAKVTICHRTNSLTNPYVSIDVAESSVDGQGGNDKGQGDHYLNHTGPVWTSTSTKADGWGDIIPPIEGVHGGLNWANEGKLIWANGCRPVVVPSALNGDTDRDQIPDVVDLDDDGDGIEDVTDPDTITDEVDTDHDRIPDGKDVDDDNDCTADSSDTDVDGDGVFNAVDSDRDNDGVTDAVDFDDDGDLVPDLLDGDANGDEAADSGPRAGARLARSVAAVADASDGASPLCARPLAATEDPTDEIPGLPATDDQPDDSNPSNESPADSTSESPDPQTPGSGPDSDSDGTPDVVDGDDDNDGVKDTVDRDADGDGKPEVVPQHIDKEFHLPSTIEQGEPTVVVEKSLRTDAGTRVLADATCALAVRTIARGDVPGPVLSRQLCDVTQKRGRLAVKVLTTAPTVVHVHLEAPATGDVKAWSRDRTYLVR